MSNEWTQDPPPPQQPPPRGIEWGKLIVAAGLLLCAIAATATLDRLGGPSAAEHPLPRVATAAPTASTAPVDVADVGDVADLLALRRREQLVARVGELLRNNGFRAQPTAFGIQLDLGLDECSRSDARRIHRLLAEDTQTADALVRSDLQWASCAGRQLLLPAPGTVIPADVEWSRFLVVTPYGQGGPHPEVFCTASATEGWASCGRTMERCRREEQIFRDLVGAEPCRAMVALHCVDFSGNRHCFFSRDRCTTFIDNHGGEGTCERRYAL